MSETTPTHQQPRSTAWQTALTVLQEVEGEPERVLRAGEAFWEPGSDVIHYQDGNNLGDVRLRFTVTMLCDPGKPMLVLVDDEELAQRQDRRAPRPSGAPL